ncbi:MAG: pseudouridine-5'-phosphate glycosidase [Spirochaetales bacterium]|nr:pseudouridine-5'-phosphate glycosidase [Spirochaetales bacterium]
MRRWYQTDDFIFNSSFRLRGSYLPQKTYSGKLTLRISPDTHAEIAGAAALAVKSLNKWAAETLKEGVLEAEKQKIRGKHITPFILARLHKQTGDKSLFSNKQLVYNNVHVAAEIAKAYSELC